MFGQVCQNVIEFRNIWFSDRIALSFKLYQTITLQIDSLLLRAVVNHSDQKLTNRIGSDG